MTTITEELAALIEQRLKAIAGSLNHGEYEGLITHVILPQVLLVLREDAGLASVERERDELREDLAEAERSERASSYKVAELERTNQELREALRKALDLVWGHHEIGFIRRAAEKLGGSCELCKDSRLLNLGKILEKLDAEAALAQPSAAKDAESEKGTPK